MTELEEKLKKQLEEEKEIQVVLAFTDGENEGVTKVKLIAHAGVQFMGRLDKSLQKNILKILTGGSNE